jgi:hypothetical protein
MPAIGRSRHTGIRSDLPTQSLELGVVQIDHLSEMIPVEPYPATEIADTNAGAPAGVDTPYRHRSEFSLTLRTVHGRPPIPFHRTLPALIGAYNYLFRRKTGIRQAPCKSLSTGINPCLAA